MNNQIIPMELIQARKLMDEGNHDDALQIIKNFEQRKENSNIDILSGNLLECEILFQQGLYEKSFEKAEIIYSKSKEVGVNIITIDALLIIINLLFYRGKLDKIAELI